VEQQSFSDYGAEFTTRWNTKNYAYISAPPPGGLQRQLSWLGSLGSTATFLVKVSGRDEDNILTLIHELFTPDGALAKSNIFPFFSAKKANP
jgi:hypothetical protein